MLKQFTRVVLFLAATSFSVSFLGCSPTKKTLPLGQSVLSMIDPASTTQVTIAKQDPVTGQRWSLQLSKQPSQQAPVLPSLQWVISIAPEGQQWIDRIADSGFIIHLLDTFRTLQPVEAAGPKHTPNFSLLPPLFAVDVISRDAPYKIQVGADDPKGRGIFGLITTPEADAGDTAWILKGSAIKMLGLIDSANKLRRQTLLPWDSDLIDELEVTAFHKKYYAQRQSETWVDQRGKPHGTFLNSLHPQADRVGSWLEDLTHLRVKDFEPQLEPQSPTPSNFAAQAQVWIRFKNRQKIIGEAWFKITSVNGRTVVLAFVPARSNNIFELYEGTEKLFNKN